MLSNVGRTLFWLHACTIFAFTTLGSSAPIVGLLQYREMQLRGKAQLLTMWTSRGSSWTFGSLGNLDNIDLLDIWISWGSPWTLDILAIWTSWQFGSLWGLRSPSNFFFFFVDLPWENSWTHDILRFLTFFCSISSWGVLVTCHKFYHCTIRWQNHLVYTWVPL